MGHDPVGRVAAKIPLTIALVVLFAVACGTITLLPLGPALGIVALVVAGSAAYTAIEYNLPDIDGDDPHDRAWVIHHMTRNTVAFAIIVGAGLVMRRMGVPADLVTVLTPVMLGVLAFGWYKWKGSL